MNDYLKKRVEKELTELFQNGYIKNGVKLSEDIEKLTGKPFRLNSRSYPGYNFNDLDRRTVFCHLNPGDDPDPLKFKSTYIETSKNVEEFIDKYISEYKDYPRKKFLEKKEFDNFDFKQSLYLSGFPENGIKFNSIDDLDFKNKNNQRKDCHDVLTQQTQLELIPYKSRKFSSIFNSQKQSDKLIRVIKPYFVELMDIITLKSRKYVIFGSTQYEQIIKSYDKLDKIILRKSKKYDFDVGTKNKVYYNV